MLVAFRGARRLSLRRHYHSLCGCVLNGRMIPAVRVVSPKQSHSSREWPQNHRSTASSSTASFAPSSSPSSPPTWTSTTSLPLCELPATEKVSVDELVTWHAWARQQVESLGEEGLSSDGGPDKRELLKELEWFLEDAVASPPWAMLQRREERNSSTEVVVLRSPLRDLTRRWKERIGMRLPFQYAVGIAHWRRVTLAVGPGVLVPRPETEQLVDLASAAFREMKKEAGSPRSLPHPPLETLPWADLGTGSGAIAVGLATEALVVPSKSDDEPSSTSTPPLPPHVFAVDASPLAASWARLNVRRLGIEKKITVLEGSWLEPVVASLARGEEKASSSSSSPSPSSFLAGVVSNPPYIPRDQLPTLQREVRDHEPTLALDGGPGPGLESLRPLCLSAADALAGGGFLALETAGKEQATAVASDLLEGSGAFENVKVHEDLFGVARFVTATRKKRS